MHFHRRCNRYAVSYLICTSFLTRFCAVYFAIIYGRKNIDITTTQLFFLHPFGFFQPLLRAEESACYTRYEIEVFGDTLKAR